MKSQLSSSTSSSKASMSPVYFWSSGMLHSPQASSSLGRISRLTCRPVIASLAFPKLEIWCSKQAVAMRNNEITVTEPSMKYDGSGSGPFPKLLKCHKLLLTF